MDKQSEPVNGLTKVLEIENRGLPTRLKIPDLSVDAPIAYVGLTNAGDMDTPRNINEVGWYKHGPLPGNSGSAVMSGHIDGPSGEAAVFSRLNKLKVGDRFAVTDSANRSTAFVVRQVRILQESERTEDVFASKTGAHLNLITCSGEWDRVRRQYPQRLVVFSEKSS